MEMMENSIRFCDDNTAAANKGKVALLIVPFQAQGHLNQLLQFAYLLSSYGLPVFYVGSEIHNRQAKLRFNRFNSNRINFHDLPYPTFESPPPDPHSDTKFPAHLLPCWYAMLSLREPFFEFLKDMSVKYSRVVVVHDPFVAAVVQDVASVENAESYVFNCVPSFFDVFFALARLGKPLPKDYQNIPSFDGCLAQDLMDFVTPQRKHVHIKSGDIYNSCRLVEAEFLEILAKEDARENKIWAIGPMVSMISDSSAPQKNQHECVRWLNKQEPKSVIYVSFGTTISLSNEQIKELAYGLEESRVKFIWVLRDADKANIFDEQIRRADLPEGFEDRAKGVGMVVRAWAPQLEILRHPSTGGFMSHCGWNSCMESMTMGVPIAAWPMHSDQPINATFITDVLKIGLIVRDWSQREEIVKASMIENAVRRLMISEEGFKLRNKAEELAKSIHQATQPGGASHIEMDSFVDHVKRS